MAFLVERPEAVKLDVIWVALRVRMQSMVDVLRDLEEAGGVVRDEHGWRAVAQVDAD